MAKQRQLSNKFKDSCLSPLPITSFEEGPSPRKAFLYRNPGKIEWDIKKWNKGRKRYREREKEENGER